MTVCQWFSIKTTRTVFSGLASKLVATVFSGLASKPVATVSPNLVSKLVMRFLVEPQNQVGRGFFWFGPQNWQLRFGDFDIKITATIPWFGSQNQVGYSLSVSP
jgi:hypothetical protein